MRNAGRLMREAGVGAVKLEGGIPIAPTLRRIVECGIPVMGHIGLTPQSYHQLGGFKVQGRTLEVAKRLLEDAVAVEQAGAFGVVLEGVPTPLAERITKRLEIPTIGIGAGPHCDGQVLVLHDMLGLNEGFSPKFLRRFAELGSAVREAVRAYADDVRAGRYPGKEHSFE